MSIFSEYKDYKYIYPPRPESAIAPDQLNEICEGWIAQPKYNGSCGIVFIDGHKSYKLCNRRGEELTLQKPLKYNELNDSEKFMVLCGEYLNKNKLGESGTPFNHKFIIWDILVWKGRYLIGETFETRLQILIDLFGGSQGLVTQEGKLKMYEYLTPSKVDDIFLAPSYVSHFKGLYESIIKIDLYEGLVLKKGSAKLDNGFKEKNNTSWQVKVRKPTKNYTF